MIVNNHQLFSHTYLARLQADPSHDEAAAPIAQGLRDWMPFRDTSSLQALIDSWVGPVLDFLEFHHEAADNAPHTLLLYARRGDETPTGLCYVVPPGQDGSTGSPHSLDDTTKGRHPMAQAVLTLRTRNLRWGVLTDGARWRLVDAQALRRYEHYVEVDLDELTRSDDPTALRLFYAFFHRSAFTPAHPPAGGGTEGGGESGLDRLVTASIRATKAAEDHLKALVSHNEGIMAQLCLGLVCADGRTRYTDAERDAIYRDVTYLLYRILFILYAEARGLLPMDNPAYRAVSLAELVKTAHDYKLHGMPDPQATTLWERLKRLCNAIYESDPVLGIPAYNGGLFDDADKPYLRDGHIADMYLTEALFDLAHMPDKMPGTSEVPGISYRPIDYRDLSVRHLGSLYEGMIEYKLHMAEETLWARREKKGNVRFLRTGQDGAPRKTDVEIEPGQVYFSQSPGERRATGTYYTPEYIVDYIVSQTVVRGLEERRAPLEEKLAGWLEEIQTSEVSETSEVSRMQRAADEEILRFVKEQVLTFRVCDIGMGSGHFLVNSAHQITNFIVETLHLTPWENPTVDADPVAWRRRVVEHCLYGVDLSLMAVELAKLSLWLASVAEGKPLSFLDHHLRQGNSLIGARLEDLAEVLAGVASTRPSRQERKAREAGQLSMVDDPAFSQHVTAAAGLLAEISARIVERVEDVKAQEADYEQVRAELEPYRRLADLWTARHFGLDVDDQQLKAIAGYLVNGSASRVPEYERILTLTQELARERSFLHWELEFPEVFLNERSSSLECRAGFNACTGNPPWGADLDTPERVFLKTMYSHIHKRTPERSNYFIGQGLELLSDGGYLGSIVPNNLLYQHEFIEARRFLLGRFFIKRIINLGDGAFEEATMPSCIIVVGKQRKSSPENHTFSIADLRATDKSRLDVLALSQTPMEKVKQKTILELPGLVFQSDQSSSILLAKVYPISQRLGDLAKEVAYGISTGGDSAFRLRAKQAQELQLESDKLKPILIGRDIERYHVPDDSGHVLIYATKHLKPEENLNTMRYLAPFETELSRTSEARRGLMPWYRLHRPRYPQLFDPPKIVCRQTSDTLIAALDKQGYYVLNSILVVKLKDECPLSLEYVLALLNSRLLRRVYANLTQETSRAFAEVKPVNLRKIPIRHIEFTSSSAERAMFALKGRESYEGYLASADRSSVLEMVETLLSQKPQQSHAVHDILAYLARQMISLNKARRLLEGEADLFRFVVSETPCLRLDKALGGPLGAGEMAGDLSAVRHDIEGLRLSQKEGDRWLLEVRAKLRDPQSDWREHQRDKDGNFIRQWLPAYRLPLDEAMGRFYHYAFAHLGGFDGAGKFAGGFTRTTLEKLKATKIPKFVPVDLAPLAALEAELAEVRRKIQLTDDLIDQIVYKLYGLTEEEIAIVEGRAPGSYSEQERSE